MILIRYTNGKINYSNIFLWLFFSTTLCFAPIQNTYSEEKGDGNILNRSTLEAIERFSQIDDEVGYYGSTASERLIQCSRAQDALLAFLHSAESEEEYLRGMEILNQRAQSFRSFCRYVTEVVNFYSPGVPRSMFPQTIVLNYADGDKKAFLNTFKTGRKLNADEREAFFDIEFADYWRDRVFDPFILDKTSLQEIEAETLYNFALLPDGTITAALERPGIKDYHLTRDNFRVETFAYPNHTILAGSPHQELLTAGAFILFEQDGKRLFFISNKSGHFQPTYKSLDQMRRQLSQLGVDSHTIILVPDVDLAHAAIKLYDKVQIPISIDKDEAEKLFNHACDRWEEAYHNIDRNVLQKLSHGNLSVLNRKVIEQLNTCRDESTYMRSAYQLFTADHSVPPLFHHFVKHFGNLKDAIKHGVPQRMRSEAALVLKMLEQHEDILLTRNVNYADDNSFYCFLNERKAELKFLLSQKDLLIEDYHTVKKAARELGTLFLFLAQEARWKGSGHFLCRATAAGFFQINEIMSATHDAYIHDVIRQDKPDRDVRAVVPEYAVTELHRYLDHFAINPPSVEIEIVPENCDSLINEAKWWYSAHAQIAGSLNSDEHDSFDPRPKKLLSEIINGHYQGLTEEHQSALYSLLKLRRFAKTARNALILLDRSHEAPPEVHHYIRSLDTVIRSIQKDNVETAREEATTLYNYLKHKTVPTSALETWQCTDQVSFNATLRSYLSQVELLDTTSETLCSSDFEDIAEHVQAIGDLMDLFRRGGIRHQTLPTVYYDLLAERSSRLVLLCQQAAENPCATVTPEMRQLTRFILRKIQTEYTPQ